MSVSVEQLQSTRDTSDEMNNCAQMTIFIFFALFIVWNNLAKKWKWEELDCESEKNNCERDSEREREKRESREKRNSEVAWTASECLLCDVMCVCVCDCHVLVSLWV